jgi:hypothetical protein
MDVNVKKPTKDHDALLKQARDRMAAAVDADQDNRVHALDDLRMVAGLDHWSEEARKAREADGRVCMVVNQLPQFLRKVTGNLRQMNPAINVYPADSEASADVAEIFEGITRHIEYQSDASSVYERAAESAAACGMGFFRILTEYETPESFNQEARIQSIMNPFAVYCDPAAVLPTREDAGWWFITDAMERDDFEDAYPGKSFDSVARDELTDSLENWRDGEKIVVAEYLWREHRKARVVMLEDGTTVVDPAGPVRSIKERETQIPVVKWAKISGKDVLDGPTELPGRYIPIVAVMGEELYTGREVYRSSVVRHAKDPQRMYDYWWSAHTEVVALQPKAPYLVTPGQIAGLEEFWNQANSANRPYLPWNPDEEAPPPQRAQPPVASQGMTQMLVMAQENLRATTGIYDASLGQASNETSGVAIRQRKMEAEVSTSIYADNMGKAIAHCGRILVDLIPRIYDTARMVRVIGKEGKTGMAPVNQPVMNANGMPDMVNPLARGSYGVRVSAGPSYATKRQEAAEGMLEFIRVLPQAGPALMDLMAKNMDWPGADQIAERLQGMLPPGLAGADQMSPQQQQQMQAAQAEQMRAQELAKIMQELELRTKLAEAKEAEAKAKEAEAKAIEAGAKAAAGVAAARYPAQPMPGYPA